MFYIYLCAHVFHHTRRKIVSVHFFRPYHRVQNSIFVMKIYRKYLFFFSPTFFSRFFFLKKIEICFIFTFLYLSSTIHEEKLFLSIFFDRTNGSKTEIFHVVFFSPTFFFTKNFFEKNYNIVYIYLCAIIFHHTRRKIVSVILFLSTQQPKGSKTASEKIHVMEILRSPTFFFPPKFIWFLESPAPVKVVRAAGDSGRRRQ